LHNLYQGNTIIPKIKTRYNPYKNARRVLVIVHNVVHFIWRISYYTVLDDLKENNKWKLNFIFE